MNVIDRPAAMGFGDHYLTKKRLFQPPDRAPQIETCGNQIVQDLIWRHLSQAQTTGSSDPISIVTKQLWVLAPAIPPIRLGEVPYRFMEAPATS